MISKSLSALFCVILLTPSWRLPAAVDNSMLAIEAQIRSVEGWLERHPEWTAQRVNGVARQRGRPEAHRSATAGGLATLRDFLRRKVEEAATEVIALEKVGGAAKP